MKKTIIITIVIYVMTVFIMGCDSGAAKREEAKKKFTLTPEQFQLQEQNKQAVMTQLNAYKDDYGAYPQSLEELKQAGYNFPEVPGPGEGWVWSYRIVGGVVQLFPTPSPKQAE